MTTSTPQSVHLLDIEKAELRGMEVSAPLTVVGLGEVYIVPSTFEVRCDRARYKKADPPPKKGNCSRCPLSKASQHLTIPSNSDYYIETVRRKKEDVEELAHDTALMTAVRLFNCKQLALEGMVGFQTVSELAVYPYAQEVKQDKGKLVDEVGREFRNKLVYYLGQKDRTVQSYVASGVPVPNPKNMAATLLIQSLEPLNVVLEGITPVPIPLDELEERVASLCEVTGIYGRTDAHLVVLLVFATPLVFDFGGQPYGGWGKVAIIGDTTTGKGATATGIKRALGLGGLAVGETASRAGLLYGIETIGSTHILKWGLIPRYDGQLLIIDGCNQLQFSDWVACREAIREGVVNVQRIVGGTHPARTRLIFIGNPKRSIALYNTRIEALLDIFQPPDIARLDLALVFSHDDVPSDTVNKPHEASNNPSSLIEPFRRNVSFAWQCPPEALSFTLEAVELILILSNHLMRKFLADNIPLVSNDTKVKLARLSLATALLCGETQVEVEHVAFVYKLVERIYGHAQLDEYAEVRQGELAEKEAKARELADWLAAEMEKDSIMKRIIEEILTKGEVLTQRAMAARLGHNRNTIATRIELLKGKRLVISTKDGITRTSLFLEVIKIL